MLADGYAIGGQVTQQQQQQQPQQAMFPILRRQFEHTFESLRQLYKLTKQGASIATAATTTTTAALPTTNSFSCPDSRFLMLIVGK